MTSGDAGMSCAQMLSSGTVFQPREVAADDAVHAKNLAEERDPVWLGIIELAGGLQDLLVLLRRLCKHAIVSFQVVRNTGGQVADESGRYLVAF